MKSLLVVSIVLIPGLAAAQDQQCAPERQMLAGLESEYGERPAWQGMTMDGPVMVTVNPDTGTWTILVMPQPGMLCIGAAGDGWTSLPDVPAGEGI